MRFAILMVLALTSTAAADKGGYFLENVGWGAYRGDLERFSPGEARLQLGGGYVRGPWALEASLTLSLPDQPYSECSSVKCLDTTAPAVDLVIVNLDLRRAWRILRPRFIRRGGFATFVSKLGVDVVLHGGPRWAMCETPRDSYAGPGLGGGAMIELNLRVVSLFFGLGMDVALLRAAGGDGMAARLPYMGAGMRVGWF